MEFDQKMKALRQMPDGPAKEQERQRLRQYNQRLRMYAGRGRNGSSLVQLADGEGRPRLQLMVDLSGNAKIEFLDEQGKVTQRIPETPAKPQ